MSGAHLPLANARADYLLLCPSHLVAVMVLPRVPWARKSPACYIKPISYQGVVLVGSGKWQYI